VEQLFEELFIGLVGSPLHSEDVIYVLLADVRRIAHHDIHLINGNVYLLIVAQSLNLEHPLSRYLENGMAPTYIEEMYLLNNPG